MNRSRQEFWPEARKPLQAAEDATGMPTRRPGPAQTHSAATSCRADKNGGGGDSVAQERDGGTPEFLSKGRDREHSEEGEGEPHHPGRERRDKMEGIHRQELVRV